MTKKFIEDNLTALENLNDIAAIKDEEYIGNILELHESREITDADIFYILSRLLLATENLPDADVDNHHTLLHLVYDLSHIIVMLHDH